MADSAGGVRLRIDLRPKAPGRRAPRLVVWLIAAVVIIPLMVILERISPPARTAVSVGVKVAMGLVFLWAAILFRDVPERGRGIPMWLQLGAVALAAFAIAALQAREGLG